MDKWKHTVLRALNASECGEESKTTYFKPAIFAVALDTRKTKAGLSLFPPAPNICSAADTKTGLSEPIICHNIFKKKMWIYAIGYYQWVESNA